MKRLYRYIAGGFPALLYVQADESFRIHQRVYGYSGIYLDLAGGFAGVGDETAGFYF